MSVIIRAAVAKDLPALGQLAGRLIRQHHEFDAQRFMSIPGVEAGYAHFFAGQLASSDVLVLAAEQAGEIVGYAYARLEPRDWNALLDACGVLHDIYVIDSARRTGVARQMVEVIRTNFRDKGAPRLVLHTASKNASAREFFARLGFRETMIELTDEL